MRSLTIERQIEFATRRSGRQVLRKKPAQPVTVPPGRVPRIARLMALAIHFDKLIKDGVVTDQAELARYGQVSRPRMSQIMDLLMLAPDIQEALLFLPRTIKGRDPIRERHVRIIVAEPDWMKQRRLWEVFVSGLGG